MSNTFLQGRIRPSCAPLVTDLVGRLPITRAWCLPFLPTEPSPEGLQLGDFTFVQRRIDILKFHKKSVYL